MFKENFQFWTQSRGSQPPEMVLGKDVRCLGLNARGLEFLHHDPSTHFLDHECVHAVRGENLDLLWDQVVFGRFYRFSENDSLQPDVPVRIGRIFVQPALSKNHATVAPDQNSVRNDCLQFEDRTFRHIWPLNRLEAFATQGGRKILLQFLGKHCYVLTPPDKDFPRICCQILKENLAVGCLNHFTTANSRWYFDGEPPRYVLQNIEYVRGDLAARADWSIVRDLRWSLSRPDGPSISMGN